MNIIKKFINKISNNYEDYYDYTSIYKKVLDLQMITLKNYILLGVNVDRDLIKNIENISKKAGIDNLYDEYYEIFDYLSEKSIIQDQKEIKEQQELLKNEINIINEKIKEIY